MNTQTMNQTNAPSGSRQRLTLVVEVLVEGLDPALQLVPVLQGEEGGLRALWRGDGQTVGPPTP